MNFQQYFNLNKKYECLSCMDDITIENYVLYKDQENNEWKSCYYCSICIKYMIDTQWDNYINSIEKVDCAATLRRLLEMGPPINFRDKTIECNNEVYKFYYSGQEQDAKLKGSLIGKERDEWIENQRNILKIMENVPDIRIINQ